MDIPIYLCNLMKRYMSQTEVVNLPLDVPEEGQTDIPLPWKAATPFGVEEVMAQTVYFEDLSVSQLARFKRASLKY